MREGNRPAARQRLDSGASRCHLACDGIKMAGQYAAGVPAFDGVTFRIDRGATHTPHTGLTTLPKPGSKWSVDRQGRIDFR